MKSLVKVCITAFLLISVMSCEETEYVSDVERMEIELNSFVEKNNLTRCTIKVFNGVNSIYEATESPFEIKNGTLIVSDETESGVLKLNYNLSKLFKYYKFENVLNVEIVK
ncbi:MAG: hypothetical protein N4A71_14375 [Carboxylicivirga sp.]|jgi:hypothetical protein|nr:hypothetical protein [Carboxylicivirga sp.]MCT4648025.1 hypothetical protein [Carboxylicivirga sp.]